MAALTSSIHDGENRTYKKDQAKIFGRKFFAKGIFGISVVPKRAHIPIKFVFLGEIGTCEGSVSAYM